MVRKSTIISLFLLPVLLFAQNVSTIGSGRDYADPGAWEVATDNDLVTATQGEEGQMYDDTDPSFTFSSGITFAGATTNSSYFRELTVASGEEHLGIEGTGVDITGNNLLFNIGENYFVLSKFEIYGWNSSGFSGVRAAIYLFDFTTVHDLIIRDPTNAAYNPIAVNAENGDDGCIIYRNLIYDLEKASTSSEVGISSARTNEVYNNTVYKSGTGLTEVDGSNNGVMRNNISVGNATTDYSGTYTTFDYNVDEDGTGTITTSQTLDGTFFADLINFKLIAGSDAVDVGVTLSSPYNIDIGGNTVSGTWDCGAWELQAAAPSSTPTTKQKFVPPTNWGQIEKIEPRGLIVSEMYASN